MTPAPIPVDFSASPYFLGMAGGVVGVGFLTLFLAKWGRKFFAGEKGDPGPQGPRGYPACPYKDDHPMVKKFMESSERERGEMWEKLAEISKTVAKMDGKLEMLLAGARVRWNSGLIPDTKERK